ncbi:hypothetical protein CRM22_005792 [Opisthorchis felineus]|uniref:GAR domain-containing protein n=1 Tax=Opisthorchis felineus TaxID=147828 RepID=A0A4S2LR08_OPIFE|nr:hypothetical protein CRM22_005792 [Opisthorchis felineus]
MYFFFLPKPPEPQPLTRMRSVEVNPAVHNGSSKSTFASPTAEEEKREENSSNPVVLARLRQFVGSTVSDKLSDGRAMKDGSAQTVGPSGDVWTGAHDNEQQDTISSDISGTSGVTSGRSSDTFVENQVAKKLALCTCCNRLHIQRLEEGRYKVNGRIYYFRRFRNHVMVRIGGGWLTLDAFLSRHDPCRRGKCVPAAVPDSRTALSSSVSNLQKTDFDSKKSLISMTTSVMALSRHSSAHSTSSNQSQSTGGGIAPTLDLEVNDVVNTEFSKPLNSSHPNLLIGAPSPEPKSLSLSTSRLPVPMHSSHRQSDISESTGPTDNYCEIIPRAPRRSLSRRGSTNSAACHSPELSRRRPSECSSSRVLSTPMVNRPDLRLSSHVAIISHESATKPNLPLAPTRIPVARKGVSGVTGSTQNSGSSIPALTHPPLPTKTYHDEHQ